MIVPAGVLVDDPFVLKRLAQVFARARRDGRLPPEFGRLYDEIRVSLASVTAPPLKPPSAELADQLVAVQQSESGANATPVNVGEVWWTSRTTAQFLDINESYVKRIAAPRLGGVKLGGRWLVPRTAVEAYAEQKRTRRSA